jgi:glycosyltransferase involved in cell wall biosynthesis
MFHCGKSPHPAHQGFADAINADLHGLNSFSLGSISDTIPAEVFNGLQVRGYDIYIAEGTRSLYGALASQVANQSTLIYLAADQSLYDLQHNEGGNRLINQLISRYGMGSMKRIFDSYIDGVISVSEFVAEYTQKLIDTPIRIAHPYIQSNIYERLGEAAPNIGEKTAVTVGSYSWYKGQDILPEVWSRVREDHPDAQLYLIGSGYPSHFGDTPGVTISGYVNDLPAALSKAALYIHPARADAFPVSVLEALRAGLPAVVTTTTGTKSLIRDIKEDMVVNRFPDEISAAIVDYFDTPVQERKTISHSARTKGTFFDRESRKSEFVDVFEQLAKDTA